jgi:hypothetical protein
MRRRSALDALLVVGTLAFLLGCGKATETPQERHAGLYRSVRAIEGAIAVGVNLPRFGELLQGAGAEMLISGDRALNPDETTMVKMYGDALEGYGASQKIWQQQIQSSTEDHGGVQEAWTAAGKKSDAARRAYFALGSKK